MIMLQISLQQFQDGTWKALPNEHRECVYRVDYAD
jgi:hypothetical protein